MINIVRQVCMLNWNIYIYIYNYETEREIIPHGRKELFIVHNKTGGCWPPGDIRDQVISGHVIDLIQEYPGQCTRRITAIWAASINPTYIYNGRHACHTCAWVKPLGQYPFRMDLAHIIRNEYNTKSQTISRITDMIIFVFLIQIVLYLLHSTSVPSFYIYVVLTLYNAR